MMKNSYQQIIKKVEDDLIDKLEEDKEKYSDGTIPAELLAKLANKQLLLKNLMNQQQKEQIVPYIIHRDISSIQIRQIIRPELEEISKKIEYGRKSIKIFSLF